MARRHGRKGRLYIDTSSGASGSASPLAGLTSWSFESSTDKEDVSAMGDDNKQYVAGLPDATGDFEGKWDDEAGSTYAASRDGLPRKFYLYPSTDISTKYFFGTAFFDFSLEGDVEGALEFSGEWSAASNIVGQGIS